MKYECKFRKSLTSFTLPNCSTSLKILSNSFLWSLSSLSMLTDCWAVTLLNVFETLGDCIQHKTKHHPMLNILQSIIAPNKSGLRNLVGGPSKGSSFRDPYLSQKLAHFHRELEAVTQKWHSRKVLGGSTSKVVCINNIHYGLADLVKMLLLFGEENIFSSNCLWLRGYFQGNPATLHPNGQPQDEHYILHSSALSEQKWLG